MRVWYHLKGELHNNMSRVLLRLSIPIPLLSVIYAYFILRNYAFKCFCYALTISLATKGTFSIGKSCKPNSLDSGDARA